MASKTRRVIKNTLIQAASQLVTWTLSWALLILLPRYLGDEGFGKLFFALSYTLIFGTLINFGIHTYLVKQVAVLRTDDHDDGPRTEMRELEKLLGNVLLMKLVFSVAAYLLMCSLIFVLPYDALTRQAVCILAISTCIGSITLATGTVFQGLEEMVMPNVALIAEKVLTTLGAAILLINGAGLIAVCWLFVFTSAVNMMILLYSLRRRLTFRLEFDRLIMKQILVGGLPFLIWIVFGEIYVRIDVLMLSLMTDDSVVGWYGAAFRVYSTLLFIPHILNTAVFPALARLASRADEEDAGAFSLATDRLMTFLLFASVPVGLGLFHVAPVLVTLLYGTGPFQNAAPSLQIFSALVVLVCVDVMLGSILIARGKEKQWAYMAVTAAVFNPLMNAWLIPLTQRLYGNGGIGAAIATLLTEMLMMTGALCLMPSGMVTTRGLWSGARALLAGLVMLLVLRMLGSDNLILIVVVGALTYVVAALAVQVIPKEDTAHILHAVRNRL